MDENRRLTNRYTILIFFLFCGFQLISQDSHYIVFSAESGTPGHAFVTFGREDSKAKMTIHDGSWGLYPVTKNNGIKSLVLGEVKGVIKDDYKSRPDKSLVLVISSAEYNRALSIKKQWAQKGIYQALKQDCLSFIIDIAKSLTSTKLNLPKRSGYTNLPMEYIEQMISIN